MKDYILDLFKQGIEPEQVEPRILEFFKDYDQSKEPLILKVQRRIDNLKKVSSKIKTSRGQEVSDKSEIENFFLDCIDEVKKD